MANETGTAANAGDSTYEATITWTTHGVPHIVADDWGSLGFGQGWACARDHFAAIADHVLKVRSERARFLGAGTGDRHVNSDLGYLALGVTPRARNMASTQSEQIRAVVEGYAAGANAWFAENGPDALPAWCRDAAWVRRPIEALDLWRVYVDLAIMASGRNLIDYIGSAEAPARPNGGAGESGGADPASHAPVDPGFGSNAWAFGREGTANGRGMVMANPHFPWWGEGRFWECHLQIPDELDVYGVALVGTPLVQMGFNRDVAWAHTFSHGSRFTVYKLDLVEGDPTTYRYGDDVRAMTPTSLSIEVADSLDDADADDDGASAGDDVVGGDGEVTSTLTRTLWSSHYGPMLNLPIFGWSDALAFTYRDANIDNDRFLGQVLAMDTADGMDSFQDAVATHRGLPWVDTLAADRDGRCWYADPSTTPDLSPDACDTFLQNLRSDPITQLAFSLRVVLLDGSDPLFEWQDTPGAAEPGLVPHDRLPQIERDDHVFNSNDPYWLPHLSERIDEHSPMCGIYQDKISARSRMNALLASGEGPVTPSGPDGRLTPDDVVASLLGNHSIHAERLLDDLIERLRGVGVVDVDGHTVDIGPAVAILADWDRRFDIDSVGAHVFRELLASIPAADRVDAGSLFAVPYDPADPIYTPRDLAPAPASGPDPLAIALARGVRAIESAGIGLAAPLGDVQFVERNGRRWPLHGGYEIEGVANVIAPLGTLARADLQPGPFFAEAIPGRTEVTGLRMGGYAAIYGVSFLMVVSYTDDGPVGRGLLVYGQSSDPESAHHDDQLADFAAKRLRPLRFTAAAIAADSDRVERVVTAPH